MLHLDPWSVPWILLLGCLAPLLLGFMTGTVVITDSPPEPDQDPAPEPVIDHAERIALLEERLRNVQDSMLTREQAERESAGLREELQAIRERLEVNQQEAREAAEVATVAAAVAVEAAQETEETAPEETAEELEVMEPAAPEGQAPEEPRSSYWFRRLL